MNQNRPTVKQKLYCSDLIMELFYKQTKNKQIEILTNALSLMSMSNSQTEVEVIAKSMGFERSLGGYVKKIDLP